MILPAEVEMRENTFGDIHGPAFSHNTNNTTIHIHPSVTSPKRTTWNSVHPIRGYFPANVTLFLGRDPEVDWLVVLLMRETGDGKLPRICILGPGGMGKTLLAVKVLNHPEIKRRYREMNLVFVPCDQASSAPLLLDTLYTALAITKDTHNTLNDILDELRSSGPIILLLDNLETPLHADGSREQVEQIIREIEQIPHVALVVTMRGTSGPCMGIPWTEQKIGPLDPESSLCLYTEIYPKATDDSELPKLLETLGYMPLAVTLMARLGRTTECTAEQLLTSFRATGIEMLGPSAGCDPRHSMNVCIRLSAESPLMRRTRDAAKLLAIISMLPAGTTFDALEKYWATTLCNLPAALQALLDTSLLECRSEGYIVLPVIRLYVLETSRLPKDVAPLMVQGACGFLQEHNSRLGDPAYKKHNAAILRIEINLQSILLETDNFNPDVIRALLILAWHQYRTRPRLEVIEHAVKLAKGVVDHGLRGQVSHCYGFILHILNQYDAALRQSKLARKAFIEASDPRNAALMLLEIADICASINSQFNEIPLIQLARIEFTYSNPVILSIIRRFRFLWHPLFRRKVSVVNEDIVRCLSLLGEAYSRWHSHSKAILHLTRARSMFVQVSFTGARSADNLAYIHHRLGQYGEAEKWALVARKEWKQLGGSPQYSPWILGKAYISKRDYDKAIKALTKGLDVVNAFGSVRWAADILLELARAYLKSGDKENGRRMLEEALHHYQTLQGEWAANAIICVRFYLGKLEDPLRVPSFAEIEALRFTWHVEDVV
ncbi:hypothetical protein C8J56DRAFT_387540 [Mycena floridula]|nr:hypothetical protein C8J56DRAFT_387540 [Mycena floridula]